VNRTLILIAYQLMLALALTYVFALVLFAR